MKLFVALVVALPPFQEYEIPPDAVRLRGLQPDADPVIDAVGNVFTVAVTAVLVADTQPEAIFLACA